MSGIQKLPKHRKQTGMTWRELNGIISVFAFTLFVLMFLVSLGSIITAPYSGYGFVPGVIAIVSLLIAYFTRRKPKR